MDQYLKHSLNIKDLFKLSLRVFKTKPLRTFLTILGMSFGIGAVLFLISLGYGLQYTLLGKLVATEDSLITMEAFYPAETELSITYEDLKTISEIEEVGEISPVAEFTGEIKYKDLIGLIIIKIVEPNYFRLSGQIPDIGKGFSEALTGTVISNSAAKLTGLEEEINKLTNEKNFDIDKKFSFKIFYQNEQELSVEESETKEPLNFMGVLIDELAPPFALIPNSSVIKKPPFFKKVLIKAKDITMVESLRDKLLAKGFLISARMDLVEQATKVMRVVTMALGAFGITALVVAAVGMFNTMLVSFLERIFEVGIIKSLGATDADVKNLFLMESFMMGFLGGIGGIILGVGAGELTNFGLNLLAQKLGGKSFDLFITPMWFILLIIATSSIIGLASGFWPAKKAAYLSPKEAFIRK